ncbi:MAG: hypothetical protein IJY79_06435, partial [Clostridia bacterium]|nr:hypothetical protein [Clostridia bacterium]
MRYAALCAAMIYTLTRDDIPLLSQWIKNLVPKNEIFLELKMGLDSCRAVAASVIRGSDSPPDCH